MKTAGLISIVLSILFLLSGLVQAAAPEPKAFVETQLNDFVKILKDPQYKEGNKRHEQDDKVWDIMRKTFDFDAVAQRALGRNWRNFNADQKVQFSKAFSELLGVTYLSKIREGYTNEDFEVSEQDILRDGKAALVKSQIVRNSGNIKVDYMLYLSKEGWRVYDVLVEGVSLVKNYRAQFDKLLLKDSPKDLIERVREKVTQLKTEQDAKKKDKTTSLNFQRFGQGFALTIANLTQQRQFCLAQRNYISSVSVGQI
jgi:phospholipid transport system substrate-binding protein